MTFDDEPAPPPPPPQAPPPCKPVETDSDSVEIDLDSALNAAVASVNAPPPPRQSPVPVPPPPRQNPEPCHTALGRPEARSLDQVFKEMRDESGRDSAEEAAAEQYRLALTYRELGHDRRGHQGARSGGAVAAAALRRRVRCSGALYLERDDTAKAVDWFERAAEAPAPTPDAGRALLYDLAETLETLGEHARALAVFVELESESGGYRDVAGRIERLSKVQAKG